MSEPAIEDQQNKLGVQESDEADYRLRKRSDEVSGRPMNVGTRTLADDEYYSMDYPRRGDCIIFSYDCFEKGRLSSRECSRRDARACQNAFQKLGFEVEVQHNLKTKDLLATLEKASEKDHNECAAFVVVFMSHGEDKDGQEFLCTYDSRIPTRDLWKYFLGNTCTTLAGKPKLFFIQACRGDKTDRGVGLKVELDSSSRKPAQEYVVPVHADILVMWGSYEGLFSFRTEREGINGSVFIHFLALTLNEEADKSDDESKTPLFDLLLRVSRLVAVQFESKAGGTVLDRNKQVPHLTSTLLRRVLFTNPKKE